MTVNPVPTADPATAEARAHSDTVLPNGLRVVTVHTPEAPLAEVRLVIPWARTEPGLAATQHALAACLGTGMRAPDGSPRTRQDIADLAADLGAEFSVVVTAESLVVSAGVLSAGLPGTLDLLGGLLSRPAYRDQEIALAHARRTGGRPSDRTRLRAALLAHAFGDHPLFAAVEAPAAGALPTAADVHALHRWAVVPAGAVLLITGEAGPPRVAAHAEEAFGPWRGGPSGLYLPPFARPVPVPGRATLTSPFRPEGQALVLTAGPARPAAAPDHAPLHLAQLVLGGHSSGRLARRIRDRYGLAYAVSATLRENRAGSWLETEAAGAPGTADRLADGITGCLYDLAEHGPTHAEIEQARSYAVGFTRFALATRAEEATALAGFVAAGLPLDWLDDYRDELAAVTSDQVAGAAARFLDPERAAVAVLDTSSGPPGTAAPPDTSGTSGASEETEPAT